MANFPNSVTVFTTKNAGDTIQPSHINTLQDEVNAMEDGFRNATAPLNSSKSTVATLSVTGGSTLTDTQINGELNVSKMAPFALVRSSAATQVANNTFTSISFDINTTVSTSTMHSTSSNPTRLIPPSSGVYDIHTEVAWSGFSTAGQRVLDILLNSTTILSRSVVQAQTVTTQVLTQFAQTKYLLQTTDFVEVRVFQDSGSTGSLALQGQSPLAAMKKLH